MKKFLIPLIFVLSFLVVSCGGEGEDNSCVNENEVRIISCATDDTKKQDQKCASGEWVNDGICYLCKDSESRIITCATDKTRDQIQICSSENWVDKGECLCPESNKFCHSHDYLSWSDKAIEKMNWDDAIKYCEDLGGRLPTIDELRTLIQNCPATETGGECGVTEGCLKISCQNNICDGCDYDESGKYSVFEDIDWFWSSSLRSDFGNVAWFVNFYVSYVSHAYDHNKLYVRCVK